jgi:hypothetical protein
MLNLKRTKIGNIDYQGGALKYLPNGLPKDFPFVGLQCRMFGRAVISGGTTSGTPWPEGPLSLIRRIRVYGTKSGGSVEIINLGAVELAEIVHQLHSTKYNIATISSGAAATYDFFQSFFIPLHVIGLLDAYQPLSLLPAWWFDDLQVEIQWRDGTLTSDGGLISAGDRAIALTAYGSGSGVPTCSFVGIQALNIDHATHNPALFKMYKKTLVTEATESGRREPLNRGGFYRGLVYRTFSDTAERPLSNAILNNAKLVISGNSKEDWPFLELQDKNKADKHLEAVVTGYAFLDFCPNGIPNTMLDTSAFTTNGVSLETELNLSGASNNRTDIIVMEVWPAGKW